jgi:hypothetical protein
MNAVIPSFWSPAMPDRDRRYRGTDIPSGPSIMHAIRRTSTSALPISNILISIHRNLPQPAPQLSQLAYLALTRAISRRETSQFSM